MYDGIYQKFEKSIFHLVGIEYVTRKTKSIDNIILRSKNKKLKKIFNNNY